MWFRGGGFHTVKVMENLKEKIWLPRKFFGEGGLVVFVEDLSAPPGFGLISGAGDDDDDGGDAEPRSALLRTDGPHRRRRKASVSPLGHSHH